MTDFSYLVTTDTEPIAVALTASGRIMVRQGDIEVIFPGNAWTTLRAAVDALHAPDAPTTTTPARSGRAW